MEKSTPIGLVVGLVLIFGAVFMGDGWITFFDIPSLVLVVGGTAAGLVTGFSFADLKRIPALLKDLFAFTPPEMSSRVELFMELARIARRDGLLALDRRMSDIDDPMLTFGLEMAIDGVDEAEIDDLMRQRIGEEIRARQLGPKFFNAAGTYAPAFGMVGTLIGLIQMMQNLSDPSQIGSGMAVAMVTTFYGALLANLAFLPMATKMKAQTTEVLMGYELVRMGVLAIVRGDSPSMVEKRLRLFMADGQSTSGRQAEITPLQKAA